MITVVTGLPRSGTTLAMKMLEAGGIPLYYNKEDPLHNALREHPDHSKLKDGENEWVKDCEGMGLKNLMPCFHQIPKDLEYRFIWMDRDGGEHAKSNRKFIHVLKHTPIEKIMSKREFRERHKKYTKIGLDFLKTYPYSKLIRVRYEAVLNKPYQQAQRIADFLSDYHQLNVKEMSEVVIPRSPRCYPGFLELQSEV